MNFLFILISLFSQLKKTIMFISVKTSLICSLVLIVTTITQAQIGIGTATPASSAKLDVTSTNKGFLPPRMTNIQRDAIVSPVPGLQIWCTNCGLYGETQVHKGSTWVNMVGGTASVVNTITNITTGKVWMDRNLGATQVAISSTDQLAYGSLYQWGRGSDGHQLITWSNSTSGTAVNANTATLSSTDVPGNTNFILAPNPPYDWHSVQNVNLWQGVAGINNPCPSGYRIPTETEWNTELTSWGSPNTTGAFNSLKLPLAGFVGNSGGSLNNVGTRGRYWSSTVNSTNYQGLDFLSSGVGMNAYYRAFGFSVRCIKD